VDFIKKMINITIKDIQPAVVIKIYQGYQIDPLVNVHRIRIKKKRLYKTN